MHSCTTNYRFNLWRYWKQVSSTKLTVTRKFLCCWIKGGRIYQTIYRGSSKGWGQVEIINFIMNTCTLKLIDERETEKVSYDWLHDGSSCLVLLKKRTVYHSQNPDKFHVVFDVSAEYNRELCNRYLLQGPDMINNLPRVLYCFQKALDAFICDVKEMFHQLNVDPKSEAKCRMSSSAHFWRSILQGSYLSNWGTVSLPDIQIISCLFLSVIRVKFH